MHLKKMAMPFEDFCKLDLPSRRTLLYPWIQERDIIFIFGDIGVGKSWFSMELCNAIGNNQDAMDGLWKVNKDIGKVKTLYCDGEMDWDDIYKVGRFLKLKKGVHILSKNHLEYYDIYPSLNLNEQKVRDILYNFIIESKFKFVVLDNLFSLWAGIDLDNAKEWNPANQWLLKLRSKGVCVVVDHHLNKVGKQMGTQAKLFNVNTALTLVATKDEEIVSFHIKTEKMRAKGKGLSGYTFTCDDGVWTVTEKSDKSGKEKDVKKELIVSLLLDGEIKSQSKIGSMVGCTQPNVSRIRQEHAHLFNKDWSCNSKGKNFLTEHRTILDDFYEGHDIS